MATKRNSETPEPFSFPEDEYLSNSEPTSFIPESNSRYYENTKEELPKGAVRLPPFEETVNKLAQSLKEQQQAMALLTLDSKELKAIVRKQSQENFELKKLISYCSFNVPDDYREACQLQTMAMKLNMNALVKSCTGVLQNTLSIHNCVELFQQADDDLLKDLKGTATNFILDKFRSLSEKDIFSLTFEEISSLLRSDKLNVPNEEDVLDTVVRWVKVDPKERKRVLPDLMEAVRLVLCDSKFLILLKDNYLFYNCEGIQKLLHAAIDFLGSSPEVIANKREELKRCK